MCKTELVVDLQGFKKPINDFVLKELAALEVNNSNNNAPLTILYGLWNGTSYLPSIKSQIRGCSEITMEYTLEF